MVRKKTKVIGRWHDNRHTLVTKLAESGASSAKAGRAPASCGGSPGGGEIASQSARSLPQSGYPLAAVRRILDEWSAAWSWKDGQ
jgi:hypothetical protein